ncbi:MAG TPA: CHRD domain-containing protein [Pyrinomonadaceae bacterium]|nr:CHRD domain-containing protein [Pyrinomonadaceae bacterium]
MNNIRFLAIVFMIATAVGFVLAQEKEQGGRPISATLTGAAEVPGPGDTDGAGTFKGTINHGQGQICYELTVSNIATPNAAHIHIGSPTEAGDVVVTLQTPADGTAKDCVSVDKDKLQEILKDPSKYYVNVHNADFSDGAVRGQISK